MYEIQVQVKCPYCLSAKVVKNGKKSTARQNFLCRRCQKQFQYEYFYQGADPLWKWLRDTAKVCSTSSKMVTKHLIETSKLLKNKWKLIIFVLMDSKDLKDAFNVINIVSERNILNILKDAIPIFG